MDFLHFTFYANPLRSWILAALTAGVVFVLIQLTKALGYRQLQRIAGKTVTDIDDILVDVLDATKLWFILLMALWAGSLVLILPDGVREFVGKAAAMVLVVQIGVWGAASVRGYVDLYEERKREEDPAAVTTVRALGFLGRTLVWLAVGLTALATVGINVTGLVAGLGIGGIAVALAVQNILGDLFASLSIVLDKPFVYGDFIIVGDMPGTVQHVGLKTTRVRSLSGEELVFSNSDLLNSRIRNFKRMTERRILFTFGVVYQTPRSDLERIPGMVREIIETHPDLRFDRGHFKGFGASSLDFEVVYFVLAPEYNLYMDRQEQINLELFRRFEAEGIEFAYPTQTLYLNRG